MKNKILALFRKIRSSLTLNTIGAVVILMVLLSTVIGVAGYWSYTNAFLNEYSQSTYHIADTATALINGSRLGDYLSGSDASADYIQSAKHLNNYCNRMKVTLVYVIVVDQSDYGRFQSVFNAVLEDSGYTPWECGYQRDTTNDEYREAYRSLYEGEKEYCSIYRTTELRGAVPHITTIVPVKDAAGNVAGLLCVQRPMQEMVDGRTPYLISTIASTVAVSLIASLAAYFYLTKQFVKPLHRITHEADRFAHENTSGETLGGKVGNIAEINSLAESIDKMETDMLLYIDNITAFTADRERIGTELAVASSIQEHFLPNIFPAFPEREDLDIYASMVPAKDVGGDFYDFFFIDQDHLALLMADVSGKGIPAALFMMASKILLRESVLHGMSPAETLEHVNRKICDNNNENMFVTVWLGIVDLKQHTITAANAGHEYPIIRRPDGDFALFRDKHGFVLGGLEEVRYREHTIDFAPGSKIFLYTDGISEATDKDGGLFGLERIVDALNQSPGSSPQELLALVDEAVAGFVKEEPQFDDQTMLCFELTGDQDDPSGDRITVDATVENLERVNAFVAERLEAAGCSPKVIMQMDLVIDELFSNIAHYAYHPEIGQATVAVDIDSDPPGVILTFTDKGKPYNPLEKPDPDITLSAEERQIGGLGIFMVKKSMDEISYEFKDGQNILRVKKSL